MNLVFYGGGDAQDNKALDRGLMDMVGKSSPHMSFIPSQSYESEIDFGLFVKQYRRLGVKSFLHFPVDIRFDKILLEEVLNSDIIHLSGGNTFYFLKHLKRSGMLPRLRDFVKRGGILTGLSAGAIIMSPNITTASFPEFDRDDNDENLKDFRSLNLVQFEVFPHYSNSARYRAEMEKYSKKIPYPLYGCPNGSGILVKEGHLYFVGKVFKFEKGKTLCLPGKT